MRKVLLGSIVLVAATALAIAAAATGAGSTAAATTAIPGCAPGSLKLLKSRRADGRRRQPRLSTVVRRRREEALEGLRPELRQGLRVGSRLRGCCAARTGEVGRQVDVRSVQQLVQAGEEAVRLLRRPRSRTAPERAQAVDFSRGYYFVNQAVIGEKGTPIAKVKTIAGLKRYKLGAQIGTTSYIYITRYIKPSSSPLVFDENAAAVAALKNGQIDGLVVDLPTAFYLSAVEVERRRHRRQAADQGDEGALRACVPEGQPAADVRRPGDREPLGERDDQEAPGSVPRQGRRARPEVAPRATAAPASSAARPSASPRRRGRS